MFKEEDQHMDPEPINTSWRLPIGVAVLLVFLSLPLLYFLDVSHEDKVKTQMSVDGERFLTLLESSFRLHDSALKRLAARWGAEHTKDEAGWQKDASRYLADFPAFVSLGWLDADLAVKWQVGNQGDGFEGAMEGAMRLFAKSGVFDASGKLQEDDRTYLSLPSQQVRDKGDILLFHPMMVDSQFKGGMVAIVRFEHLVESSLHILGQGPLSFRDNYSFQFMHGSDLLLSHRSSNPVALGQSSGLEYATEGTLLDLSYDYRMWPVTALASSTGQAVPLFMVAFMTCSGVLVACLYTLRVKYQRRSHDERLMQNALLQQITERSKIDTQLKQAEQKKSVVLNAIQDVVIVMDAQGEIQSTNPAFETLFGYTMEEALGKNIQFLMDPQSLDQQSSQSHAEFMSALPGKHCQGAAKGSRRITAIRKNQEAFIAKLSITEILEKGYREYVVMIFDITEQVEKEREIEYLALYDHQTGFPSLRLMNDRIEKAISVAKRQKNICTLLYVDLTGLKVVGEVGSDTLRNVSLLKTSERIMELIRASDTASRIGDSNFLILMNDLEQPTQVEEFIKRMVDSLSRPFEFNSHQQQLTVSIGVAIYPEVDHSPSELIHCAEQAALYSKQTDGLTYYFAD